MDYTDIPEEYLEDGVVAETTSETVANTGTGDSALMSLVKDPVIIIAFSAIIAVLVIMTMLLKFIRNRGNKVKSQAVLRKEKEAEDLKQQREILKQHEREERNRMRRASGLPNNVGPLGKPSNKPLAASTSTPEIPITHVTSDQSGRKKHPPKSKKQKNAAETAVSNLDQVITPAENEMSTESLDTMQQIDFDSFFTDFEDTPVDNANLEDESFFSDATVEELENQAHLSVHSDRIDKSSTKERLKKRNTALMKDETKTKAMEEAILLDNIQSASEQTPVVNDVAPITTHKVSGVMEEVKDVREAGDEFEEDPFFNEDILESRDMEVVLGEPDREELEIEIPDDLAETFDVVEDEEVEKRSILTPLKANLKKPDKEALVTEEEVKEEPVSVEESFSEEVKEEPVSVEESVLVAEDEPLTFSNVNATEKEDYAAAKGSDLGELKLLEDGYSVELPKLLKAGKEYTLASDLKYEMDFKITSIAKSFGLNCDVSCTIAKANAFDNVKHVLVNLVPQEDVTLNAVHAKLFTDLSKIARGEVVLDLTILFE